MTVNSSSFTGWRNKEATFKSLKYQIDFKCYQNKDMKTDWWSWWLWTVVHTRDEENIDELYKNSLGLSELMKLYKIKILGSGNWLNSTN